MSRKEEIRQEAYRKYPYEGGLKGMICENSIPIFIQGAEWADKTMVDKACQWIKELHIEKNIGSLHSGPHSITFDEDTFIEEFRKAMEE